MSLSFAQLLALSKSQSHSTTAQRGCPQNFPGCVHDAPKGKENVLALQAVYAGQARACPERVAFLVKRVENFKAWATKENISHMSAWAERTLHSGRECEVPGCDHTPLKGKDNVIALHLVEVAGLQGQKMVCEAQFNFLNEAVESFKEWLVKQGEEDVDAAIERIKSSVLGVDVGDDVSDIQALRSEGEDPRDAEFLMHQEYERLLERNVNKCFSKENALEAARRRLSDLEDEQKLQCDLQDFLDEAKSRRQSDGRFSLVDYKQLRTLLNVLHLGKKAGLDFETSFVFGNQIREMLGWQPVALKFPIRKDVHERVNYFREKCAQLEAEILNREEIAADELDNLDVQGDEGYEPFEQSALNKAFKERIRQP